MKHYLHKIFGLNNLYERKYGASFLVDGFFVVVLVILLTGLTRSSTSSPLLLTVKYGAIIAIMAYAATRLVRFIYISTLIKKRQYILQPQTNIDSVIKESAISNELESVDMARLIEEGSFWKLYDATFDFFRQTKHGKYKSKQAYYTVFEAKIHRNVPHLIFDSKTAKNRQFRYLYLQSQRISLEGNFDEYFDTYAPQHYEVDALSFITPEVMEALMAMAGYDVEFIEDSVLCYGPLLSSEDMPEFRRKCLNLHSHVNDNLHSYRDNRLGQGERSQQVSDFGKKLLDNPARFVPTLVLSGIGTAVVLYLVIRSSWQILFEEISLIIIFLLGQSIWRIKTTIQRNRQLEAEYHFNQKVRSLTDN